jgi:hypothetical protein
MNRLPSKSKFDWLDILERLSRGESYTPGVFERLDEMAQGWPTCACGQLCQLLDRDEITEAPCDHKLKMLGVRFADEVSGEYWCKALATFNKIEARSKQLLIEGGHLAEHNVPTTKEHAAVH